MTLFWRSPRVRRTIRSSRQNSLLFLVDAQLPGLLAGVLRQAGCDAIHVADLGLATGTDGQIWDEAVARAATRVTKDRDFALLRGVKKNGPTILWVRVGNIDQRGEAVIEFVGK